uniref:Uncharacterized protein n=1 Tax=Romanomermis culicivorax TaxID=13658 RepID=A0A915HTS0_ROMCU
MDQSRTDEPLTEPDSGYFSPGRGVLGGKSTKFDFDSDSDTMKNDDYAATNNNNSILHQNFRRLSISATDLHMEKSTVYRRRRQNQTTLVRSCSDPCSIVGDNQELLYGKMLEEKIYIRYRPIAVVAPTFHEKKIWIMKNDHENRDPRFLITELSIYRLAENLRQIADRLDEKYFSMRNPVPFPRPEIRRLTIFRRVTNFCVLWYRIMKNRVVWLLNNVFH